MRTMKKVAVLWIAVAVCGCTDSAVRQSSGQASPAVSEAQTQFTYKGKPIPPFFLTDFLGGPDAGDFWTRRTGSRITAVAVPGLFVSGDGAYASAKITDRSADGGYIRFTPSADTPSRGYFGYRFVGTSPSGVTVLEYVGNTGGSGTIHGVLFVRFEMQPFGLTKDTARKQLVMRFAGEDCWGDRVNRDVKLVGDELQLGPETSRLPANKDSLKPARTVVLK